MTNLSAYLTVPDPESEPTIAVPATGTHVVDGGYVYDVDHQSTRRAVCYCTDLHHRTGRDPWDMHATPGQVTAAAKRQGGHVAVEYQYAFVGSEVTG